MKPNETPRETPKAASATAPKKRLRLDKLEERIAPRGHWNPQSKWVGGASAGTIESY